MPKFPEPPAAGELAATSPFHRPLSDPTLLTLLRNAARDLGYVLL